MARPTVGFPIGRGRIARSFQERVISNAFRAASHGEGYMTDLLKSWIAAGCRWDNWEAANGNEAVSLQSPLDGLRSWQVRIRARTDGKPTAYALGPTGFGPGEASEAEGANTNKALAYEIFALFIVAAAPRAEVGICERCKQFYWNRWGHTNKRFCSRRCAQRQTAIEGQRKRLSREWGEKNKRIRSAILEFVDRKPTCQDWRAWVCRRAGVSKGFLTRTLRRGERGEPEGLVLRKRQRQFLQKGNGR
jgi:hypothetical protein